MILQDHVIKVSCEFMGSYHPAKFGGHRHRGSEDINILVCHLSLQDHVIERSCDLREKSND